MAKSASGALEIIPLIAVTNLVQAIETLKKSGYWIAGLDGSAKQAIYEAKLDAKTALVLGAEGAGLRQFNRRTLRFHGEVAHVRPNGKPECFQCGSSGAL